MDIGIFFKLPLGTRGYLIYQLVGSALVNALINFGFAWQQHAALAIAVFGSPKSVLADTCLTAALLSGLTVLSGSWFVRRDQSRGVVGDIANPSPLLRLLLPLGTLLRACLFALVFTLLSVPLAMTALVALGYDRSLSFPQFLVFKLTFAIVLGALVTPLNAALVIARRAEIAPEGGKLETRVRAVPRAQHGVSR